MRDPAFQHRAGALRSASVAVCLGVCIGVCLIAPAPIARAAACDGELRHPHQIGGTTIHYTAKGRSAGYRFSLGGLSWELRKTRISDPSGQRVITVTYPLLVSNGGGGAYRDFFISVDANVSDAADCNDLRRPGNAAAGLAAALTPGMHTVPHVVSPPGSRQSPEKQTTAPDGELADATLFVTDDYRSRLRPGVLTDALSLFETERTLAAELRVREAGLEIVVATGFASTRTLDLSACLNSPQDSVGIVEGAPGEIHVSCFPVDETSDYVSDLDWTIDYRWPSNASAVIDELIDYVDVELQRP